MLRYKIDIMKELKSIGYNSRRLRTEKLLSEGTMTNIRAGVIMRPESLDTVCRLLKCQPGMLIEWLPDDKAE